MLRFCQEHKGSISILLLCVTFAMLIFSFVTLDISKANLASATARSNADIVGNAVLSDYDVMLKDAYGLFANSKSLDELSKNVTDYYLATMSSNGIEVKNTNDVYKAISGLINDASIAENNNLLQLKAGEVDLEGLSDKGSVVIQPVNESAISNPTVMRRQIVEYMKYRAPITLATGMLEKLNVLKDLNNQTTATTKKIEYEDALNDVQNSSDVVYEIMNSYINNITNITDNKFKAGNKIGFASFELPNTTVSGKASGYSSGSEALVARYNTLVQTVQCMVPLKSCMSYGDLKDTKFGMFNHIDASNKPANLTTDLDNLINSVSSTDNYLHLKKLYNKYEYSAGGMLLPIDQYAVGKEGDATYKLLIAVQPLYDSNKPIPNSTGDLAKFYRDFYKLYYYIIQNQTQLIKDGEVSAKRINEYTEIKDMLEWAFGNPNVDYKGSTIVYQSTGAIDVLASNLYRTANTNLSDLNSCYYDVLSVLYYQREMAYIMSGAGDEKSPLDALKEDLTDAIDKSGKWKDSINNVNTESYKASMMDNYEIESENFDELSPSDVDAMKQMFREQYEYYDKIHQELLDRVQLIHGQYMFEEKVATFSFHGLVKKREFTVLQTNCDLLLRNTSVASSSSSFSAIVTAGQANVPSSDITCAQFAAKLTQGTNKQIWDIVKQISEKNIIANEDDKTKMKEEGNKAKENLNTRKAEIEKSQQDEEKEATKANNDDMSKVTGIPTFSAYIKENSTQDLNKDDDGVDEIKYNENKPKKDEEADGAKNLLSEVGSMFLDLAEAGRDNLYIAEYITGTFSCVTTAKNDGEDTTEDDPEESITGLALNPKNNKHYRAEVEYILYGFGTETGNKAAAIGTISAIRFALNLIYSFTDPEINTFTTSTASAIGALVPFSIPIIKTTLHILLSGAETAWDMLELTKGNSVPLYKNSATWVCKASNIAGNIAGQVVDIVVEPAVKAVTENLENKITEFVDGTASDVSSFATDMTTKTANDIKSMLKTKITTPVNDFITDILGEMESATDSITAEAESLVDTIIESLETSRESESEPGSVIYMAYGGMIDYLTTNKSYFAGQINGLAQKMMAEPTAYIHNFQKEFDNYMSGINAKIDSVVENLNDEINSFVSETATEVKDLAVDTVNAAGDQLLDSVESGIASKLSGTRNQKINLGSGKDPAAATKGSTLSNLLSMSYKDYLYVFLILGMINGTETELSRAAQLMQTNINHQAVEGGNYEINKGVTMFNVYTSAKVKTSVMGRFADSEGITLKNFSDGYYEIQIRSFAGY